MSAITTEQLSKRYGNTLALDSLLLVVEPGEVCGYLGPNDAAPAMLGIAAAASLAALQIFDRRDLTGA